MLNLIKNLTPTQWVILFLSTAGFLNASAAQLTEWFGPTIAHAIISVLGFTQGLIGSWAMALNGQGSLVKQVLAMDGVEKIDINGQANATLAKLAVDKTVDKIAPTTAAMATVEATAKAS